MKEELYFKLLQKREENERSQACTAYNTRVITAPRGSLRPTAPKKMKNFHVAFAVGLLLPAVVIVLRENMNTKVRGRKDLESVTVPLVGEIPLTVRNARRLPWKKQDKHTHRSDILITEGSRDIVNEAFRVLRSNIDFMSSGEAGHNVFVLTSFNPGSGKSFIAMNLATSFAIKGKRVLVIDGDLRHGSTSSYVSNPKHGLTDYLSGQHSDIKSLVVPVKSYPTLHVLPIGKVPPNPTELLENGRLAEVLSALRSSYDYIFIDCPPIDIVADTQIIEKFADRTIFVVRAGLLERSMLTELQNIYDTRRFKNLSLILNGTQSSGGRYSYRYGYRYGYHYGYAYGYGSKSYYSE